jgi:hypothetical protein
MDERMARQWVEKIIQVQSGLLTASEAARQLGASRKTYHKHQKELLCTMLTTLTERRNGRPPKEQDEEKNALFRQVSSLQEQVKTLEGRLKIRQVMQDTAGLEKKGTGDGNHG